MGNLGQIQNELNNLVERLEWFVPGLRTIPYFSTYIDQIKNFNSMINNYCKPDKFGKYPPLTAAQVASIMKAINEIRANSEKFKQDVFKWQLSFANPYSPLNLYYYYMALNMDFYKVKDMFGLYVPELHKSFKDLAENYRGIHISSSKLYKPVDFAKLATGEKVEVEIKDGDNQIKGFFQKEKSFNINQSFDDLLNKFEKKYPQFNDVFESIKSNIKFADLSEKLKELPSCFDKETMQLDFDKVKDVFSNIGDDNIITAHVLANSTNPNFVMALFDLSREVIKLNKKYEINVEKIGLNDTESVTQRTTAVADLAKMIGASDIVPQAKMLTIDPNHSGVFEAQAQGIQISKIAYNDAVRNLDDNAFYTKEAMQEIAKLQILDYITGNVDRDMNKLFLNFDNTDPNNPKLVGITGIDNKASFTVKDDSLTKGVGNMPSLANLKFIDEYMAKDIIAMDKAKFILNMNQYNLSEEAVNKAWERMEKLQTVIKNSTSEREKGQFVENDPEKVKSVNDIQINIMKEEDWKDLKIDDTLTKDNANYFKMLKDIPAEIKKEKQLNNELAQERLIASNSLDYEVKVFPEQLKSYVISLEAADKSFFKFNRQCTSVIDTMKDKFAELDEISKADHVKAEDVYKIATRFVEIQQKTKEFLSMKEQAYIKKGKVDENNQPIFSDQDKARVNILKTLNSYLDEKIQKLYLQYGDLAEAEIKMKKDEKITGKKFENVDMSVEEVDIKFEDKKALDTGVKKKISIDELDPKKEEKKIDKAITKTSNDPKLEKNDLNKKDPSLDVPELRKK